MRGSPKSYAYLTSHDIRTVSRATGLSQKRLRTIIQTGSSAITGTLINTFRNAIRRDNYRVLRMKYLELSSKDVSRLADYSQKSVARFIDFMSLERVQPTEARDTLKFTDEQYVRYKMARMSGARIENAQDYAHWSMRNLQHALAKYHTVSKALARGNKVSEEHILAGMRMSSILPDMWDVYIKERSKIGWKKLNVTQRTKFMRKVRDKYTKQAGKHRRR